MSKDLEIQYQPVRVTKLPNQQQAEEFSFEGIAFADPEPGYPLVVLAEGDSAKTLRTSAVRKILVKEPNRIVFETQNSTYVLERRAGD